jgi:hypothetical protein
LRARPDGGDVRVEDTEVVDIGTDGANLSNGLYHKIIGKSRLQTSNHYSDGKRTSSTPSRTSRPARTTSKSPHCTTYLG